MLLKPTLIKDKRKVKHFGYITFNKAFVEDFITQLDKSYDLNLQLDRSLPMIYKPANWKSYNFGGYYLR